MWPLLAANQTRKHCRTYPSKSAEEKKRAAGVASEQHSDEDVAEAAARAVSAGPRSAGSPSSAGTIICLHSAHEMPSLPSRHPRGYGGIVTIQNRGISLNREGERDTSLHHLGMDFII